jgi:hypothetical protein
MRAKQDGSCKSPPRVYCARSSIRRRAFDRTQGLGHASIAERGGPQVVVWRQAGRNSRQGAVRRAPGLAQRSPKPGARSWLAMRDSETRQCCVRACAACDRRTPRKALELVATGAGLRTSNRRPPVIPPGSPFGHIGSSLAGSPYNFLPRRHESGARRAYRQRRRVVRVNEWCKTTSPSLDRIESHSDRLAARGRDRVDRALQTTAILQRIALLALRSVVACELQPRGSR